MNKFLLTIKPIFKKKTTLFTFILLGVLMALTILIQTYHKTVYNAFYGEIDDNMNYTTFSVGKVYDEKTPFEEWRENMRTELENVEHIIGVFHGSSRFNGATAKTFASSKKLNGTINLYAANNETLLEIVEGTNFPDEEGYYMVCSKNFIPTNYPVTDFSRFDMLDLTKYLNKNIKFKYMDYETYQETLEIEIKLVGISKNSASLYDENACYVTESTLAAIHYNQIKDFLDTYDEVENNYFYIQIDSLQNKEEVTKDLKELGYENLNPTFEIAYELYDEMVSNVGNITIIVNVAIFIFLSLIMFKQYHDFKEYYKLLDLLGYDKKYIQLVNVVSNLLLLFVSTLITLFMCFVIKYILNMIVYFRPVIFCKWDIIIDYSSLLFIIPLAFITTILISIINCYKLININGTKNE